MMMMMMMHNSRLNGGLQAAERLGTA